MTLYSSLLTLKPRYYVKALYKRPIEWGNLASYSKEIGYPLDCKRFLDYYDANGWKIGKNPMKDWKACVRTWEKNTIKTKTNSKVDTQIDSWKKAREILKNS